MDRRLRVGGVMCRGPSVQLVCTARRGSGGGGFVYLNMSCVWGTLSLGRRHHRHRLLLADPPADASHPPRRAVERVPPSPADDRHRSPPRNSSVLYTKNKQTNITCTHIVYIRGTHTRTHTISQTPTLCRNKHTNI